VELVDWQTSIDPSLAGLTFGLRIDVLRDDECIGSQDICFRVIEEDYRDGRDRYLEFVHDDWFRIAPTVQFTAADAQAEWRLRLRGLPEIALGDFGATRCWKGEMTVPLEMTYSE
jgi:hypothetical protein